MPTAFDSPYVARIRPGVAALIPRHPRWVVEVDDAFGLGPDSVDAPTRRRALNRARIVAIETGARDPYLVRAQADRHAAEGLPVVWIRCPQGPVVEAWLSALVDEFRGTLLLDEPRADLECLRIGRAA